ncbi:lipid A biosynthesis acyltransferase [Rhodocyclus tenuis]|uniref:Lipid A biosynthesis acyltransferase n=2 Tax=Rhodocyclus TaxID=1064 RepID=A0A6L5JYE2_RHOTE|nr:lipid A biosynthesis acyltransferase [Rhodocyclus gracilis]MQY51852.1 lipid A biosynthesis acyltransferase [Rhodocyclus gracilis]MRD73459.1 lipid A biosynthesis acyltransferase [Rhodocyclus gracilis]NJA88431.1 lipid A biosynthesis acyltransferase [Rhodocyclus gracilis]
MSLQLPSRLLVGVLWLLHWLPLPALRALGALFGEVLYLVGRERRRVALRNIGLCFPSLDAPARRQLVRRHFVAFARAFLDRTLLWWAPRQRLERLITVEGSEHLLAADGRATILLAPHFVGLDAGGSVVTMMTPVVSVYANQKNPVFNAVLLAGRLRFNAPLLLSRQDGMRRALRALRDGLPFYYLPDMDYGARDALFTPFFGVPAATITGVSRLARLANARVVPCITRMTDAGYTVELQAPWEDFPGESVELDTRRMNAYIESQVLRMPEQYFWLHKRFKTRPPGEAKIY